MAAMATHLLETYSLMAGIQKACSTCNNLLQPGTAVLAQLTSREANVKL